MRTFAFAMMITVCACFCSMGVTGALAAEEATLLLNAQKATAILPPSVFYRGKAASIQGRNSGGLELPGGRMVLFTLVDTSGYSSSVQETYQAYLLTEVPLHVGGHTLQPGSYGFGFIAGDKMVVMDIGGNQILSAATMRDGSLKRPTPLQITGDVSSGETRLYLGRSYVTISPAAR